MSHDPPALHLPTRPPLHTLPTGPCRMTLFDTTAKSAVLSDDGTYRYVLTRTWSAHGPILVWLMLNPSTADADVDDPTVRRCIAFAKAWGYAGIVVVNLFALRATNPAALNTFAPNDPIGPLNNDHLLAQCHKRTVICAWGASVPEYWRHRPPAIVRQLREVGADLYHLGLTKDRHPRHPLYVRGDTQPTRWAA